MKVYRVISEWDIGQDYVVFDSEETAMKWLTENNNLKYVFDEDLETLDDCIDDGLISIEELTFITESNNETPRNF